MEKRKLYAARSACTCRKLISMEDASEDDQGSVRSVIAFTKRS